jgi:hypothetical protein
VFSVAAVLTALTPTPATAGEVDLTEIHRELSPIAKRLKGSGVHCRSVATADGSRHKLQLASLKIRLNDRIWLRAGVGAAHHSHDPFLLAPRTDGLAVAGVLSVAVWEGEHFALDLTMSALRARYSGDSVADGTVLLALRKL